MKPNSPLSKSFTIRNQSGFHSRPVADFVTIIKKYPQTQITLSCKNRKANGGSFLDVLSLCASKDDNIQITVDGPKRDSLMDEITAFFEKH